MDAIDILGALLGRKTQSSGPGGDVLKDIMAGKTRPPAPPRPPVPPRPTRPQSIDQTAKSLEEILNVSREQHTARRQSPTPSAPPPPQPAPQLSPTRPASPISRPASRTARPDPFNEQAKVLVRAMVKAAKSDGQITQEEQQAILHQLGDVTQEEIDFLRNEFAADLDVRDFAWSVPLGMEEQVYQISVIAIDLDEHKEAQYLADLAHGLRLAPERCNEIHRRLGAPIIFQE